MSMPVNEIECRRHAPRMNRKLAPTVTKRPARERCLPRPSLADLMTSPQSEGRQKHSPARGSSKPAPCKCGSRLSATHAWRAASQPHAVPLALAASRALMAPPVFYFLRFCLRHAGTLAAVPHVAAIACNPEFVLPATDNGKQPL